MHDLLRFVALTAVVAVASACGSDVSSGGGGAGGDGDKPLSCNKTCPGVVAAGCDHGPPTVDACLQGCAAASAGCPDEFAAVSSCAGEAPTYKCDATGAVVVVGCESENSSLTACLSGS